MIGSRILGAACVALLLPALGAVAGCSSEEKPEGATAQTIQAASVSLAAFDESGTQVAEGSGILISPRVVLTSGHLIAGNAKWSITSSSGKKTANGVRGLTYDWMNYESDKSHPRKHDVGVIYLDRPIDIAMYPKVSPTKLASGSNATRVRHSGGTFSQTPAKLEKFTTFPNAYVTSMPGSEALNTGGAVVNNAFEIVGLVTGRGNTSGKLHIATVNDIGRWLAPKIACGHQSSKALNVRTYGTPDDDDTTGTAGGNPDGGSSTNPNGSNPNGSNPNGSNPNGSNPNGSNPNGDGSTSGTPSGSGTDGIPSSCNDGGGGINADGSPNPYTGSSNPSGSSNSDSSSSGNNPSGNNPSGNNPSGSNPTGSSGSSGSNPSGSNPTGSNPTGSSGSSNADGSSSSGTNPDGSSSVGATPGGSNPSGTNPDGSSTTGSNPSGSNPSGSNPSGSNPSGSNPSGSNPSGSNPSGSNADGSTSSSNPNGSNPSGTSSSGNPNSTSGSNSPTSGSPSPSDIEKCTGPTDNADVCPPEANGCSGSSCGGGTPDDTIDYGGCGSCSKAGSGTNVVH